MTLESIPEKMFINSEILFVYFRGYLSDATVSMAKSGKDDVVRLTGLGEMFV